MVLAGSTNVRATAVVLTLLLLLGLGARTEAGAAADVVIAYFYSCDRSGKPQDYFPKETAAYFNVTLRNLGNNSRNVSVRLSVEDELEVSVGSSALDTVILPGVVSYYMMSIFIPRWAFVGVATAYVLLLSAEGIVMDSKTAQFYIGPKDTKPPLIHLLSPGNLTYVTDYFPLAFIVDERTSWTGYSLDGTENVTVAGNTTLTNLANGSHSLIVYANDTSGNVGSSEEAFFSVWVIHDLAVVDLKCSSREVYAGQIVDITVFIRNEGTVAETLDIRVYANTSVIQTFTFTNIDPGNQTALVFTWDTTNEPVGSYILLAKVIAAPGEIDTADNTFIGTINVMARPDIAIGNIALSKTVVGQGYTVYVNVTIENKGHNSEGFSVTAYANTTIIEQKTVTLTGGNSTTITLTWNTANVGKGNYTITVQVPPLLGEVNTQDNTLTRGWIVVTRLGDVNGDGKVDGRDTALIGKCFNTYRGQPGFLPNADINGDGRIDGKDLAIVAKYFGEIDK